MQNMQESDAIKWPWFTAFCWTKEHLVFRTGIPLLKLTLKGFVMNNNEKVEQRGSEYNGLQIQFVKRSTLTV